MYGFERFMQPHAHNPYPTWTYDRGEDPQDTHPWSQQAIEVNPEPNLGISKHRGSVVDQHQISVGYADPGRTLTHPSRIVAPLLIGLIAPQNFDVPYDIIQWAPNPIVQRSYGQQTAAIDDVRHTIPKQILGYSYDALSQQEIADQAALRVRRAMYGG